MKKDKFNRETVPCKWCGKPTPMLGTELCDRCWELDGRIRRDLDLAKKIVAFYSDADCCMKFGEYIKRKIW